MDIKGTAVKSIDEFIKKRYPDRYNEWLSALPNASRKIFLDGVLSNQWYPVKDAAIIPTKKIGELFYNGDLQKGAWECGRYSAEVALTGIYKIYVKLSKPFHLVDRASRIFAAYYYDSVMSTRNPEKTSIEVIIEKFDVPSDVIEYRIGGWIEKALEISGCTDINIQLVKSLAKGSLETV